MSTTPTAKPGVVAKLVHSQIAHAREERAPAAAVQRVEDREAGIAEAAGELERPDAVLVHDRVEVDVADVAGLAQQRRERGQRASKSGSAPL